jgi:hypothetical protein
VKPFTFQTQRVPLPRSARLTRELDAWMQTCVIRHDENRYGCTLSAKLFIGVEYVMKHIKVGKYV